MKISLAKLFLLLGLIFLGNVSVAYAQEPIPDESGAIQRALALIGHPQQRVILYDPLQYSKAHRKKIEGLEAFILEGQPEIYLNFRGRAYGDASSGLPHGIYILGVILAHEVVHLGRGDERAALAEERRLVYKFMKEGYISQDVAMDHLRNAWEKRQ